MNSATLVVGTSGWSYKDWVGPFYPEGADPRNFLREYVKHFSAVEIDSTFYGIPKQGIVDSWGNNVPEGFIFAPKFPKVITHDKRLLGCDAELELFLGNMKRLGPKLGPLILQFDYTFQFDQLHLLASFLNKIPAEFRLAVEIRHKSWLNKEFYTLLKQFKVALTLVDLYYMPRLNVITADFTYIRLLGNRKEIPDDFSHVRIDRERNLDYWAETVLKTLQKGVSVYVFVNNRFQGHAPASVRSFMEALQRQKDAGNTPSSTENN